MELSLGANLVEIAQTSLLGVIINLKFSQQMIPSLTDTSLASDIELRQLRNSRLSSFALMIGHHSLHWMIEVVVKAIW